MRNPAFPGQTSDMSDIRKTKTFCKHPKSSFSRANIRYVRHLKNQKVLHTCENQLYLGKHPICQTSEKPKVLQTSEKQLFQGKHPICQTSEKLKSAANMRKAALPGKHPIFQTSEKPKSAANIQKTAFPGQTSDKSDI